VLGGFESPDCECKGRKKIEKANMLLGIIGKKPVLLIQYFVVVTLKFETQSFTSTKLHIIRVSLNIKNTDNFDSIERWGEQIEVKGVTDRRFYESA
jgi:hypothetical protein